MADNSSRSLLAPHGEYSKARSAWTGERSTYKTPLFVFTLLVLLVGSIISSAAILLKSHEEPVDSWRVQPSVLLSFLCGVYAITLGGLFTTGVAITWWRSLAHGTTLKRLHFISTGADPKDLVPAFLAGSDARRVVLAALVVFIAKLSIGPFTQRATRPRPHDVTRNVDMNIHFTNEIPDGWFGSWGSFHGRGLRAAQDTFLNSSMATDASDRYYCAGNGACDGLVSAAGINFGCSTTWETIKLLDPESQNSTIFSIDVEKDYSFDQPMIFLTTKYIESVDDACTATLRTDTCNIIPATVWYPISIRNTSLTLDLNRLLAQPSIKSNYTSAADILNNNLTAPIGPLEGIFRGLGYALRSEAFLGNDSKGGIGYDPGSEQLRAVHWSNIFLDTNFTAQGPNDSSKVQNTCSLAWRSPTMPIIGYMYDFMFRAAYAAADKDKVYEQSFIATYRGTELWYMTDFRWLAASIGIMVLGSAAAMSLLWGWWQLDRYVSLSPLETGKAFGAPIFAAAGPEREANGIVKEIGHERVAHDGDELVWSGSVYASGTGLVGSLRGRVSGDTDGRSMREMEGGSSGHSSVRGRGHRRGMSSASEAGSGGARPSFEHSLGVTTRRPYDDEEEVDVGHLGRHKSGSGSRREPERDAVGLMPLPLSVVPRTGASPSLPPIPQTGSLRLDHVSVGTRGRGRSGSGNGSGSGKRPLSSIVERSSPTP
ncbi:hypothetical protein K505DRAFT_328876 [Melanomma pulvis-pyrius CBS 109.77]|uniref:Uncharacterized protein n=1 Tax=Melanomma pulvis-pyrius CBS 109.77 TaxID=1314802 RepID=A0A6A6WWC2_9PLEO|nr:hypothetical protein K505DRAFT_328876 [Melanomma pulvis-pyrius CBS 109.77]